MNKKIKLALSVIGTFIILLAALDYFWMFPLMILRYGISGGFVRQYECIKSNHHDLPIIYQYPLDGQREVPLDAVVIGIFKEEAVFSDWSSNVSYEDNKPLSILSGYTKDYFLVGNLIEHKMVRDSISGRSTLDIVRVQSEELQKYIEVIGNDYNKIKDFKTIEEWESGRQVNIKVQSGCYNPLEFRFYTVSH